MMRWSLLMALALIAAGFAGAALAKPQVTTVPPPPDPDVLRQGGDTIADAVPITLPYEGVGSTTGYTDDYDEACPYGGSTSPDVVYALVPAVTQPVIVDLRGSGYDTKVYVYDADLELVDCNDDHWDDYTSRIAPVLTAGQAYYIVVDGYGGDHGDYVVAACGFEPWVVDCPDDAYLEGEPPQTDDYVDEYNSGCSGGAAGPVQPIAAPVLCGVGSWSGGVSWERGHDWFAVVIPAGGELNIDFSAEIVTRLGHWSPADCDDGAVVQSVVADGCRSGAMTIAGEPGSVVWLWVAPVSYQPPGWYGDVEYHYLLEMNVEPVAADDRSMTGVRGLFR